MTGTSDVTTCTDIVYGKPFHRLAPFLLKIISRIPVPGCALLENGIRYHDSDFTVV